MADSIERLRIVCMDCPAVARVLLRQREFDRDAVLLWVECHGTHVLAWLEGRLLLRERSRTPLDAPINVPMQALQGLDVSEVVERRASLEAELMRLGAQLDVLDQYLAEDGPKTAPTPEEPQLSPEGEATYQRLLETYGVAK